jgi:hypothetical protein
VSLTPCKPPLRTDFDLEDAVLQTNQVQDWMLEEEDRASIEFDEALDRESVGAPVDNSWQAKARSAADPPAPPPPAHQSSGFRFLGLRLPPAGLLPPRRPAPPLPTQPRPEAHTPTSEGQTAVKPSRQAVRRKRQREANPTGELRSERLEGSRVKRLRGDTVETEVDLKTLKPGLKLPAGCEKRVYTLPELVAKGFKVQQWDGL